MDGKIDVAAADPMLAISAVLAGDLRWHQNLLRLSFLPIIRK